MSLLRKIKPPVLAIISALLGSLITLFFSSYSSSSLVGLNFSFSSPPLHSSPGNFRLPSLAFTALPSSDYSEPLKLDGSNENPITVVRPSYWSYIQPGGDSSYARESPSFVRSGCSSPACLVKCNNSFPRLSEAELESLDGASSFPDPEPVICGESSNRRFFPISLSLSPLSALAPACQPAKYVSFSDIPLGYGNQRQYSFDFQSEASYYRFYRHSYFGYTRMKGGWDCLRHYEIIQQGGMPLFHKIEKRPKHTLTFLPHAILEESSHFPGVSYDSLTGQGFIDFSLFNHTRYFQLLQRLQYFASKRLTTAAMSEYIIRIAQREIQKSLKENANSLLFRPSHIKKILFFSSGVPDYLSDNLLTGLLDLFGPNVFIYNPPTYLFYYPTNSPPFSPESSELVYGRKLYGNGFSYWLRAEIHAANWWRDKNLHSDQETLKSRLENHEFDLIVFGSIHQENSFLPVVQSFYHPSAIILIDGEDIDWQRRFEAANWKFSHPSQGILFVREIPDNICEGIGKIGQPEFDQL